MANQPGLPDWDELRKNARPAMIGVAVLAILIPTVLLAIDSYFQVEAGEEAVVLRLGVPTRNTYGPGLHFKIPVVDRVYTADVKKVHQLEFGFRTTRSGAQSEFDETSYDAESLMLTGDLSLVHVQWTVFYRIADPEKYFFQVRDVEETIRDLSEATMRLLVGDRSNDEVMTEHRAEIAQSAREQLQEKLDRCDSGIFVERVALRQVDPPLDAQAAFNKVNDARARQQQLVEQAKRGRVEALEAAKGERDAVISEARGHKAQVVESARGEALRFLKVVAEYHRAPRITRQWLYYDAVSDALEKADDILVLPATRERLLEILPLSREAGRALEPFPAAPSVPLDNSQPPTISPAPTSPAPAENPRSSSPRTRGGAR